jgi:hypothetical protein
MVATYQLKPNELTADFLQVLKSTFHDKVISLTVEEIPDETAYLLSTKANREHLLAGITAAKSGKPFRTLTIKEMDALVSCT